MGNDGHNSMVEQGPRKAAAQQEFNSCSELSKRGRSKPVGHLYRMYSYVA